MIQKSQSLFTKAFTVFLVLLMSSTLAYATPDYDSTPPSPNCVVPTPKTQDDKSLAQIVDEKFSVVVGAMATVLFWQPVSFQVTDANGKAVMTTETVYNDANHPIQLVYLIKKDKNGKPVVDRSRSACLNQEGSIQTDDNGNPYMLRWTYNENVQKAEFKVLGVHPLSDYVLKPDGKFYTQNTTLQKQSSSPLKEGIPLVVLILMCGALFYTLYYKFINLRLFKHAIQCVRGVYDDPNAPGEISHFQALTSALSGTVGLGNIASVAVAVSIGGPGAVFWLIVLGLLGMSSKFHECALGQIYRSIDTDGRVFGGPTAYLSKGFKELGFAGVGKILAGVFSVFIILASIGGGNMFQANQSFRAIAAEIPFLAQYGLFFGMALAVIVGLIIIGGIKRIGEVTEKLVPAMCGIYVLVALWIIITHISEVPTVFGLIFAKAFSFQAGFGGFVGVAVQGIRRAVFSNEAGLGSASFAHSAAKTDEPVREGIVSLLEPFIDTVVICTMTALVILITGAYNNPIAGEGVEMTRYAFSTKVPWFPTILSIAVFLFALSTMITWSYYGEKACSYLFGHSKKVSLIYKMFYLCFIVVGCLVSLDNLITFTDLVFLSLAFPNILGGIFLSKKVGKHLKDYTQKLRTKQFAKYK